MTAIKVWHITQGFDDPTNNELVKKTLKGIKRLHGKPKEKAPILQLEDLERISVKLKASVDLKDIRDHALLLTGFFGAFRRSELVGLNWEDINWVPEGIEIMLQNSKTDQTRTGQICAIPYGNDKLCAVRELKKWQEESGQQGGPIFRALSKEERILPRAIAPGTVNIILKEAAKKAGLPEAEQYSGHSLRRGFATCASRKGVSFQTIMRHGRWRSERTVLDYIEEGQRFEDNAARIILR